MLKNEIEDVIHLGDLVDKRKNVSFTILNSMRKDFITPLFDNLITIHFIVGNHDSYYRNTNSINAIKLIISRVQIQINSGEKGLLILGKLMSFRLVNFGKANSFSKRMVYRK